MQMSQYHYLPLTPGFFSILVGIFLIVFVLLMLGACVTPISASG